MPSNDWRNCRGSGRPAPCTIGAISTGAISTPHGLASLGRLRGYLPRLRSLLMDEGTLLAHRALCVDEPDPHRAERIGHLDAREQALYSDLRGDRWGVRLRLEQERIGWNHAWPRILAACR